MKREMPQRVILRIITMLFFIAAFAFYSLIAFGLFPSIQNSKYSLAAENYQNGKLPPEDLLDFSTLYLQIHVAAQTWMGNSVVPVQWLQILLTAFSIAIFFRILLRFFPLWLSVAGSIALLMQRSLIISAHALDPESLIVFLLLAFLYLSGSKSFINHLLAGIFLALMILIRPDFSLLILVVPVFFLLKISERRSALISSIACSAPAITALTAIWFIQAMTIGYFSWWIFIPGNAIYEGNNPIANGLSAVYPPVVEDVSQMHPNKIDDREKTYRRFARSITQLNLTTAEVKRYWSIKSVHFLQDNPHRFWVLLANKAFYFFHDYQWHESPAIFANEIQLRETGIPAAPFCVFSALAIAGFWLGAMFWRKLLLFYAAFFFQFLFILNFYLSARFRAPLIPLFIFFGLAAIHGFVVRWKTVLWLIFVLPGIWFFHSTTNYINEETRVLRAIRNADHWNQIAYQKRAANQWMEAAEAASKSLSDAPFLLDYRRPSSLLYETENYFASGLELIPASGPQNLFDRGFLSLYANLPGQAEIAMQEVQKSGWHFKRDQYQSPEPLYYLAQSSWMRGNKQEAESRLRATLKQSPADPWALAALYVLTNETSFRGKLFDYFDNVDAQFFIGEAALEFGNAAIGIDALEYVVQQLPEYRKARIFLAGALTNANRLDQAEGVYRLALQMSTDPAMRESEILALFLKLSERNPENPERLYMYGYVLRQFGHYQEALVIQQLAAEKSQSPAIKAEIAALQMVLSQLAASD
jgi:tetratricopeptide (TPR) repeat protein